MDGGKNSWYLFSRVLLPSYLETITIIALDDANIAVKTNFGLTLPLHHVKAFSNRVRFGGRRMMISNYFSMQRSSCLYQ